MIYNWLVLCFAIVIQNNRKRWLVPACLVWDVRPMLSSSFKYYAYYAPLLRRYQQVAKYFKICSFLEYVFNTELMFYFSKPIQWDLGFKLGWASSNREGFYWEFEDQGRKRGKLKGLNRRQTRTLQQTSEMMYVH